MGVVRDLNTRLSFNKFKFCDVRSRLGVCGKDFKVRTVRNGFDKSGTVRNSVKNAGISRFGTENTDNVLLEISGNPCTNINRMAQAMLQLGEYRNIPALFKLVISF
jgi:hypothetical protein